MTTVQKEYTPKEIVILITEKNLVPISKTTMILQKECAIKETVVQVAMQNLVLQD
jgi:hypothetical protein